MSISTGWTTRLKDYVISLSEIFHPAEVRRPLAEILKEARETAGLTVDQAAAAAKIPLGDVLALEEGRETGHAFARIHAASYARVLGLDPVLLRKDLPESPELIPSKGDYLRNVTRPARAPMHLSLHLLAPLAPLGRACVYLLMMATLLSTWGLMRQLSRVRSIPWITSNSSLSSFQVR